MRKHRHCFALVLALLLLAAAPGAFAQESGDKPLLITLPVVEDDGSAASRPREPIIMGSVESQETMQALMELWYNDGWTPADVGSVQYHNEMKEVAVLLTRNSAARQAEIRRLVPHPEVLRFFPCKYSHAELEAAFKEIGAKMSAPGYKSIIAVGIGLTEIDGEIRGFGPSGEENRVVVTLSGALSEKEYEAMKEKLVADYGDKIYVEQSAFDAIPMTDGPAAEADAARDDLGRITARGRVNARSGPGTEHDRLGTLRKGDSCAVTGKEGSWFRILYKDGTAYVHSEYADWDFSPDGTPFTASGRVNVRSGPGTKYTVLGKLSGGDTVTATALEGKWMQIEWKDGAKAYVSAAYLNG